jgi:hypothetical protein
MGKLLEDKENTFSSIHRGRPTAEHLSSGDERRLNMLLSGSWTNCHNWWLVFNSNLTSLGSVVGIAAGYGLNWLLGVRVPVGTKIFSAPNRPDRRWGPTSLLSNGYRWALSPGVKRPVREADYSPPTNVEIKKIWIYTSTPHTSSWHSA